MKKLIYLSAFVLTTLLTISCSSDSDGSSTGGSSDVIVGTWKYLGDIDEDGFEPSGNLPCEDQFVKFNSDGTGILTFMSCGEPTFTDNFTWAKASDPNRYTAVGNANGAEDSKIVFSENNTRMTISNWGDPIYAQVFQRQ